MNREEASFILANIDRRVCDDELNEALDMAIKALEQEPKIGHWIKTSSGFKCSKCLIVHPRTSIYCPSCGAKMVEPQESEGTV